MNVCGEAFKWYKTFYELLMDLSKSCNPNTIPAVLHIIEFKWLKFTSNLVSYWEETRLDKIDVGSFFFFLFYYKIQNSEQIS